MPAEDTQQIPVQRDRGRVRATGSQQHRAAAAGGSAGEGASLPPSAPQPDDPAPAPAPAPDDDTVTDGRPDGAKAEEMRTLARTAFGLVVGLALLVGCGFAVEHLTEWGHALTLPAVFVLFTLVMLLASQLVVGGFSAVWAAARPGTDKR